MKKENATDHPLISVIVPVYNGESFLAGCVESIENQTYPNLEVIIINDGSTDETGSVCTALMERFDNIRVITLEDRGVSVSRNTGIDAAKGGFITFVDADDRLRAKTLQILYEGILSTGSDMAGCSFNTFHSEEEWQDLCGRKYRIGEFRTLTNIRYLEEELVCGNSRCWSKLYRRGLIGEIRFKEGLTIGEDMLFLMDLIPYCKRIAETDYPGYGYYKNPKGAMNRKFTLNYMDQIVCWEEAREKGLRLKDETLPKRIDLRFESGNVLKKEREWLEDKFTAHIMMSVMLVVGKLAQLSGKEREAYRDCVKLCRQKIQKERTRRGAYSMLDAGYKLKVSLFEAFPSLYIFLYHLKK